MPEVRFAKYHALGNAYLVIEGAPAAVCIALAPRLCDPLRGLGGDGLLLPERGVEGWGVTIVNPDASVAEVSGNGARILARYLWDRGFVGSDPFPLRTSAGRWLTCRVDPGVGVAVDMGPFDVAPPAPLGAGYPAGWSFTAVSVGNPHAVIAVDAPSAELARRHGPLIEVDARFPQRTNVQFVRVRSADHLEVEIWERGAGYTLASGSSACAAAIALHAEGRVGSRVRVAMPGGTLDVAIEGGRVTQAGPVVAIGSGVLAAEGLG
jgi:diaminopimelate epimerase